MQSLERLQQAPIQAAVSPWEGGGTPFRETKAAIDAKQANQRCKNCKTKTRTHTGVARNAKEKGRGLGTRGAVIGATTMLLASCRVTLRLVDHRLLPLAVVQSTCRHCSHSALGCGTCLSRSIRSNSQHVCGHINGSTSRVGLIQRHFTGPLPDDVSKEVSFQKASFLSSM